MLFYLSLKYIYVLIYFYEGRKIKLEKIIKFFVDMFGSQFFIQYLGEKILDRIALLFSKNEVSAKTLREFYQKVFELLCKEMKFEFDYDAICRELADEDFLLNKINDKNNIDIILRKLLGKDYNKRYGNKIEKCWEKCIKQCLQMPEFEHIYKSILEKEIDELQSGNKEILTELRQIKHVLNKKGYMEYGDPIKKNISAEFEQAMEYMEDGEYELAIKSFKKLNHWLDDMHKKYVSYFMIAFCYSQLNSENGYENALIWYLKSESKFSKQNEDRLLLYRNIALTYIYIGESENKIDNYKKSNEYFKKVILNLKDNNMLYYYEALIHIARNYMDMCDELPMDKVSDYLEISENIMSFVCCCECELTEELMFVLVHNMARLFYHKAEKVDFKYMKTAQKLYEYAIELKYARQNPRMLAMLNINIGMSYQYDIDNKLENAKKAIPYYETGIHLYESISGINYRKQIENAKLDIASANKTIYCFSQDIQYFENAVDIAKEIINQERYTIENSLLFRTYILQLYLYIDALKNEDTPEKYIDLCDLRNRLDVISKQINYEKYNYTYQLLVCELELITSGEDCEKSESIKEKLLKIKEATYEGNKNIYDKAKDLLDVYF